MATPTTVLSRCEVEELLVSILEEQNMTNPIIEIESGSIKGDGYMSFLTKVDITSDENEALHLIIKAEPRVEELRKAMPMRTIFLREMYFYETIVKKFEEFQKQRGVFKKLMSVPKCFKTVEEDGKELLVMENIKMKGYRMWNRKFQMDEEHVDLVFKQYAKYHAISYAMRNLKPDVFEDITSELSPVFSSETLSPEMYDKFINNARNSLKGFIHEFDKDVCDSIEKYLTGLRDFFLFMETARNKNSVIIHGDCWCNNMMFKYEGEDAKKPTGMCFLDFQLCILGSPMLDLVYFFHVSAPKHILYNYKHHLNLYYEELKEHYLELGGDPKEFITIDDLLNEWKTFARFGFTMALFIFKAMMCDDDEVMDFNDINEQKMEIMDVFSRKMNNDDIVQEMTKILAVYMYDNDLF